MNTEDGALERHLSPRGLLLGVLCSFVACCVAGRLSAGRHHFTDFARFHHYINSATLYLPTVNEVQAVADDYLDPDKVAVVVGSSSVLFGTGQRGSEVWTRKLQEELGDNYRVLNLALPACGVAEFGGNACEFLEKKYRRLIFVTSAGQIGGHPPDGIFYRYFFWEAHHRGLLIDDPHRTALLQVRHVEPREEERLAELQLQARLDPVFNFRDLWNMVTYRHVSTVNTPMTCSASWRPRQLWPDPDPGPALPFAARNPPEQEQQRMQIVRGWLTSGESLYHGPNACAINAFKDLLPPPCRRRSLAVVVRKNPYYVQRFLSPAEQTRYDELFRRAADRLEQEGFAAIDFGPDLTPDDFYDLTHFSEEGGRKMAAAVAGRIRRLAHELGYVENKEGR